MKENPHCVALLVDIVGSRGSQRQQVHDAILAALDSVNDDTTHLDPLHVTVGDELQGVYATVGDALRASHRLRDAVFGVADLRFGLGGGEVRIIDAERGIQDGSAWWLAREAMEFVKDLAEHPGHASARTCIRDGRPAAIPAADALARLVDASLAGLRDGSRRSLIGLLQGLENAEVAKAEDISASANSQRVTTGQLKVIAEAMEALHGLP